MSHHARPNLFLIGTPKAATTSLADWLSQHSMIQVPAVKEPWYFNDDRSTGHYVGQERKYLELFQWHEDVRYYVDATPDYLYSPSALEQIATFSEDARYLVTFRAYPDAYVSLHQQERFMNLEAIDGAEAAFTECNERRRQAKHSKRPELKSLFYDERLRIGAQLMRALEFIPRDHILFIDFSVIRDDPQRVWREVQMFLGLPLEEISYEIKNSRKAVASGRAAWIMRKGKAVKSALGIKGKSRLADALREKMSPPAEDRPQIAEKFREQINYRFRYDRALVERFAASGPAVLAQDFLTGAGQDIFGEFAK